MRPKFHIQNSNPSLLGVSVLFLWTFLLFSFSNFDGSWILDDLYQVQTNQYLHSISNIPKILTSRLWEVTGAEIYGPEMYRPVFLLSYLFDVQVFGVNARWFHLHNNFLHSLNVCLLFLLLIRFHIRPVFAFFGVSVFAIHPMVIEAVTWIGGRMDLLAGLFSILSFHLIYSWFHQGKMAALVSLSFLIPLGIFSKETFLPLPFLFLVGLFLTSKNEERRIQGRRMAYALGVLVFLSISCLLWRKYILKGSILTFIDLVAFTNLRNLLERFFTILVVPLQSEFMIPYEGVEFVWTRDLFPAMALILAFVTLLVRFYKNPSVFIGMCLFLGPLFPVSLVLDLTEILSERYLYLPLIGFSLCLGVFFQEVWAKIPRIQSWAKTSFVALLLVLSFLTVLRNREWINEETLYQSTIKKNPMNHRAHYALAWVYLREGNLEAELKQYEAVLAINPNHIKSLNNLSVRLIEKRDFSNARRYLDRLLQLQQNRAKTHYNFGFYFESKGDLKLAHEAYERAIVLDKTRDIHKAKEALARIKAKIELRRSS